MGSLFPCWLRRGGSGRAFALAAGAGSGREVVCVGGRASCLRVGLTRAVRPRCRYSALVESERNRRWLRLREGSRRSCPPETSCREGTNSRGKSQAYQRWFGRSQPRCRACSQRIAQPRMILIGAALQPLRPTEMVPPVVFDLREAPLPTCGNERTGCEDPGMSLGSSSRAPACWQPRGASRSRHVVVLRRWKANKARLRPRTSATGATDNPIAQVSAGPAGPALVSVVVVARSRDSRRTRLRRA